MSLFKSEEINNATEELILTGMLHNTGFLTFINQMLDVSHFENEDCATLAEMVLEFYDANKSAPGVHSVELLESIKDIVGDQGDNLERLLRMIDKRYGGREIHTNILLTTYKDWMKGRSLREASKDINKLLDKGMTAEAEDKMEEVRQRLKHHGADPSLSIDIFNPDIIPLMEFDDEKILFFNNMLDDFMPPQAIGRFYTFLGGKKTGKSQWLQYLSLAGLDSGLNVLTITFELTEPEYLKRLWCGITGCRIDMNPSRRSKQAEVDCDLPIFDCERNRNRTCERPECPDNDVFAFTDYEENSWEPCSHCIGTREFLARVWKEPAVVDIIRSPKEMEKEMRKWRMQHSGNLRILPLEPGTMTVEHVKDEIMKLQFLENFIPHLIVIDAADNMLSASKYQDKRHEIGNIWLYLSALAKRGYLVWTASQTNRTGWGKEWIDDSMIAEDASKLMVVDGAVTINEWLDRDKGHNEKYWMTQRLRAQDYRNVMLPHYDVRILNDFSRYLACIECARIYK